MRVRIACSPRRLSLSHRSRPPSSGRAQPVTLRLEVIPGQRLPVEATFACSICGQQAGVIRLVREGGRAEVRRESWPGVAIYPLGDDAASRVHGALVDRDVARIFELNLELTPFYCPTCDASYCSDHWDWWDVWDEEWPAWRDSVRGRCPQGHERMLED